MFLFACCVLDNFQDVKYLDAKPCVPTSFWNLVLTKQHTALGFEMQSRLYGTRCAIDIRCKFVCKIVQYLSVRNVAAKFGYFCVFCWMPLCHWDCHKMMWLPAMWCDFPPFAVALDDVTFLRVMWLKPGGCSIYSIDIPFSQQRLLDCLRGTWHDKEHLVIMRPHPDDLMCFFTVNTYFLIRIWAGKVQENKLPVPPCCVPFAIS